MAAMASALRVAYWRTNFGLTRSWSPSRSWNTSTCPSQAGPAPMPMVGTPTASVTDLATTSGTASTTMEKHPASASRVASVTRPRAASASLPWTLNPPRACTD